MKLNCNFIGLWTLVRREGIRTIRIWRQTLLPPAITMTLYFTIFGHFIGSHVPAINNYTYIQFLAPGLVMMSIITNSYSASSSAFFSLKFGKSIEEILVSPMSNIFILLGFTFGGVLRGLMVATIVSCIALIFTHIHVHHIFFMIFIAVSCSFIFAIAGVINGIFATTFDEVTIIPTFILTPLSYLGGVFYSINQLGPFWHSLSKFNPILYLINIFRFSILDISEVSVIMALVMVVLLGIVLFITGWYLLYKGVGLKD